MKRSLLVGIAALFVTGAALWWWASRETPDGALPSPQPSGDDDALADIPEDDDDDGGSERVAERSAPAQPLAPAAPTAVAPAPPPPPASTRVATPSNPIGPVARLKHAFESDPVDADAPAAVAKIRAQFGSGPTDAPSSMLLAVQCHERACKVELRWTPDQPFGFVAAGTKLTTNINHDIAVEPIGPQPDAQGARRLDVYVARDGYAPEDFDPVPAAP